MWWRKSVFFWFTSPFTLRIPACPSEGCDYLYPSPTVTPGQGYPLGVVSGPQILVFNVLACNPAYANLCFYGSTAGLGGDRYGVALNPYSGEYDDLVFEVLYERPEEKDTLVVSLVLARDSVGPFLDREFNAATQYWHDANTPARLDDVIDLEVHATWEPSGRAASGAQVTLSVEPVDSSGGHPHGPRPRPKGTFFRMEDRPTASEQQKCGVEPPVCTPGADLMLTLDESGSTRRCTGPAV